MPPLPEPITVTFIATPKADLPSTSMLPQVAGPASTGPDAYLVAPPSGLTDELRWEALLLGRFGPWPAVLGTHVLRPLRSRTRPCR